MIAGEPARPHSGQAPPEPLRGREVIAMLAAAAAVAAWWLWPLPRHAASALLYANAQVPGITADFHLIVWSLAWDAHALATRPLWKLFDANILHPSPLSLAYSEHFLGLVPLFAPVYAATGNPILATNAAIFLTYPLCAAAMYALARQWVAPPAAAIAGFAYAFTAYRFALPPYVHFLATFCLPLVALFALRWLDRGRAIDLAALSVALLLQLLASYYLAYATLVALGVLSFAVLAPRAHRPGAARVLPAIAALAAVAAVFAAVSAPYLALRARGLIPAYGEPDAAVPDTLGLLPYFGAKRVAAYFSELAASPIAAALAAVAFLPPLGRRRWPAALALAIAASGVLLAFGRAVHVLGRDLWSPYALLAAAVPGFATIRQPMRFILLFELGTALLAGLGAGRLLDALPRRVAWALAVAAIAACVGAAAPAKPLPLHPDRASDDERAAYAWLARHGTGRPLLEVPRPADAAGRSRRMLRSTAHWLPIVEGYAAYYPRTDAFLYGIARALPDPRALQELVDFVDLGWILVHAGELSAGARAAWDSGPPPGLVPVEAWGALRLYRVELAPADDRRARLVERDVTVGGVPIAPIAGACPGALRVVSVSPDVLAPRGTATIGVEVRNDGDRPWPGLGFYPPHLVRLRHTLATADGRRLGTSLTDLPDDVRPGRPLVAHFRRDLPPWPEALRLTVDLVQIGDGPLDGCGVAPVAVDLAVPRPVPDR